MKLNTNDRTTGSKTADNTYSLEDITYGVGESLEKSILFELPTINALPDQDSFESCAILLKIKSVLAFNASGDSVAKSEFTAADLPASIKLMMLDAYSAVIDGTKSLNAVPELQDADVMKISPGLDWC